MGFLILHNEMLNTTYLEHLLAYVVMFYKIKNSAEVFYPNKGRHKPQGGMRYKLQLEQTNK